MSTAQRWDKVHIAGITRCFNSDRLPRCLFCVAIPLRYILTQNKQRFSLPVKHNVMYKKEREMVKKSLILILLVFIVSSCAETRSLWNNYKYVETITHILVSEDGSNIVVVGKNYHYVFKDQKSLAEL